MFVNFERTGYNIVNNNTDVVEIVESLLPKALQRMMQLEEDLTSTPLDFFSGDSDGNTEH